jgi:hypothetical protein
VKSKHNVEDSLMSTNLVSLIMQFLTPDVISRIASALGLDRNSAQTAIGAAVPALLAGFTGAAASPGGAQDLLSGIKQQSGILGNFTNMIGGGQSTLLDQGSSLLRSVIGGQDQAAIAGAVSKYAGIGQGAGNSLLAMLAPVAMGVIGKQLGGRNLDVGSLTGLLASQKDQIVQAMPAGFDRLLANTDVFDAFNNVTGTASAMTGQAARAAGAATDRAGQFASDTARAAGGAGQRAAAATTSAVPTWAYWAIPLLLAAGIVWYAVGRGTDQVAQSTPPAVPAVQSVMVGGVDVGKQLGDSLNSLRSELQGITDVASARAALPRVQTATAQVEKVNGMLGQLSADQRKTIAGMTAPAMASLSQLFDKVLAIPGVGAVLKPAADTLKTRLADLSTQSATVGSGRQ